MHEPMNPPGPYTVSFLLDEARTQLPHLLRNRDQFLPGFKGIHRLPVPTRVAVHLRASRLLGCPVCAGLFPRIATRQGFTEEEIANISAGWTDELPGEIRGAVAWAEAILAADGEAPYDVPEPALALSDEQRDHLHYMLRLERLVHATGLMFLPHSLIERAALG